MKFSKYSYLTWVLVLISFCTIAQPDQQRRTTKATGGKTLTSGALRSFTTVGQPGVSSNLNSADGVWSGTVGFIPRVDTNDPPTGLRLTNSEIAENSDSGSLVGLLEAIDPNPDDNHTFEIIGGVDAASFDIINGNELVAFITFDFETKSDYSIDIRVTDDNNEFIDETVQITVTNVNEAPTDITLSNSTVAENSVVGTVVGLFSASDPDGDSTFTYSLSGDDAAFYSISGDTLKTAAVFDFESDSSNYNLSITVSDGNLTFTGSSVVSLQDVNEAPDGISLSDTLLTENQDPGAVIGLLSTSDQDVGDSFTYSIAATDSSLFLINGDTLKTRAVFDFESSPTYNLGIITSDGEFSFQDSVSIQVINVNEAPVSLSLSASTIEENQPAGTVVGSFTSTDADVTFEHIYALADSSSVFKIEGNELSTLISLDFEEQSSYSLTATVTDEGGLVLSQAFTISVLDVNEVKDTSSVVIDVIADQEIGNDPIQLTATVTPSDADIVWTVIAGSATIEGNILTLGDEAGQITVKAQVLETDEFLGSEDTETFDLLNPALITPILTFDLPESAFVIDQVQLAASVDAQGANNISSADVVFSIISGPGTLSGNTLSFSDIGIVTVSATLPATEATNEVSVTQDIEVLPVFDVSGFVTDSLGAPFSAGFIAIFDIDNVTNSFVSTIAADGSYSFTQLPTGSYTLFVNPADTSYVVTYLGNVSTVLDPDASFEVLKLIEDSAGVNIQMVRKPTPAVEFLSEEEGGVIDFQAQSVDGGGNRFVMGRVHQGDPIPNTLVILNTINDEYIDDGLTDADGNIRFTGLPTGDYKLIVEVPGVGRVSAEVPVEEGTSSEVTGLIDEEGIAVEVEEPLSIPLIENVQVYPNPVTDLLKVEIGTINPQSAVINLYSITGRRMVIQPEISSGIISIDVTPFPAGMYLLIIKTESGIHQQKIQKQ